jgi:hypothetical protein
MIARLKPKLQHQLHVAKLMPEAGYQGFDAIWELFRPT